MKEYKKVLESCVLFFGMNQEEIGDLIVKLDMQRKKYRQGAYILRILEPVENIDVILAGEVEVLKETPSGAIHMITKLSSSDIFGEVPALSGTRMSPVSVIAQKETEILRISVKKWLQMLHNNLENFQRFQQNVIVLLANKALYLNKKTDYLLIKSMRGRLCTYFYELYFREQSTTIQVPLNWEGVARFLNVSRPSMSRELGRMKSEGLISYQRQKVTILNMEKFIDLVE